MKPCKSVLDIPALTLTSEVRQKLRVERFVYNSALVDLEGHAIHNLVRKLGHLDTGNLSRSINPSLPRFGASAGCHVDNEWAIEGSRTLFARADAHQAFWKGGVAFDALFAAEGAGFGARRHVLYAETSVGKRKVEVRD